MKQFTLKCKNLAASEIEKKNQDSCSRNWLTEMNLYLTQQLETSEKETNISELSQP